MNTLENQPTPAPAKPVADPIERAPQGCCEYIVREDSKQKECGLPGAYKGRTRPFLTYCKTHGEFVGTRSFEVIAMAAGPDGVRRVLKPFKFQQR